MHDRYDDLPGDWGTFGRRGNKAGRHQSAGRCRHRHRLQRRPRHPARPDPPRRQGGGAEARQAKKGGATEAADTDEAEKSGLSAKLVEDLTVHRTVALQAMLAGNPKVALAAVAHALALATFYPHDDASSVVRRAASPRHRRYGLRRPPAPTEAFSGLGLGTSPKLVGSLWKPFAHGLGGFQKLLVRLRGFDASALRRE